MNKESKGTDPIAMATFNYKTGEPILPGDHVRVAGKGGTVQRVIPEEGTDSVNFACTGTGGVLLAFDDGDIQLWPWADEDLEFVRRGDGVTE